MSVRFVPLDAMSEFRPGRLDEIVGWLEDALPEVGPPIGADRIDVLIVPGTRVVPGWDVNGFANGAALITLTVDPGCAGREKRPLAEQLKGTLAHELHPAMRTRGPGYGRTLGEALVSEGLACCYEEEIGCPTPNYGIAVQGAKLGELASRAVADWDRHDYNHRVWFFGANDPGGRWPWSGGYSLGYAVVKHHLEQNQSRASGEIMTNAQRFRPTLAATADSLQRLPADEFIEDTLIEMANLTERDTNVPGTIFVSTALGAHGPRVKWYPGTPGRQLPCLIASIGPEPAIRDDFVGSPASRSVTPLLLRWVGQNQEALLRFWSEGETWDRHEVSAFLDGLRPLAR